MRTYTWGVISHHLYAAVRILEDPPSLHKLRTYLIDISFLNQKTHEDIRISIHWDINIRQNKFIYEKINGSVELYPPIKSYLNQRFQISQLLKYDGNRVIT